MEQFDNEQRPRRELSRRTIVKGAAWSVPVIAAAIAVPAHAAASGDVIIEPNGQPVPTGVCTPLGTISFTVTQNGAPIANQAVIVTLPAAAPAGQSSFHWDDNSTAPKTFTSDANGIVDLTNHIVTSSTPGTYTVLGQVAPNGATSSIQVMVSGVWVGNRHGNGGNGMTAVYNNTPADLNNPGTPDYWAWCVEHNTSAKPNMAATVGDLGTYLGSNYLAGSADIYSKVLWVVQNSYPAISLADFSANAEVSLTENEAIEAVQYAVWRYTDLTSDADWSFDSANGRTAYRYLLGQINAGMRGTQSGMTGLIFSEPTTVCGTPTGGNHAQSQILVVPA